MLLSSHGPTRSLSEATLCRFQRGVNDNSNPYSNGKENQSAIEEVSLSENRIEPVLTPEGSDGVNHKVDQTGDDMMVIAIVAWNRVIFAWKMDTEHVMRRA